MATAVVVGSGPNGLAGAIRMARAGFDVTVCEANAEPGGGTLSGERTLPGLVHDDCAAVHPLGYASPYFRALRLERHGLRWRWPEVDLAHPLDDGTAGVAARGGHGSVRSLGVDAQRWNRIVGPFAEDFPTLLPDLLRPVAHVPFARTGGGRPALLDHPALLARFGACAAVPATRIAGLFRGEAARSLFTGVAAHAFGRLDAPLSSAVGLVLGAAAHAVGWPVVQGGTAELTRALLVELDDAGGTVQTGVHVRSRAQLREIAGAEPDVVLLDTTPRAALEILGGAVPPRVRRALRRYRHGPAAFKVDLAVEGGIPWRNTDCRKAGTVHVGGTAREIAAVEADTARGRMPDGPFILVGQQYLCDPGRSRNGVNPVYAYAHVPAGYDGDATDAVVGQIERFAPGFRERIVAVEARGPRRLEAANANYKGGDIGGGANTARQTVLRPRAATDPYRLGLDGVFLCSSSAPPGGGVHGMAGFHAAGAALRKYRVGI